MGNEKCDRCLKKWRSGESWVSCGACKGTFHASCEGLNGLPASTLQKLTHWKCTSCVVAAAGPKDDADTFQGLVNQMLNSDALKDYLVQFLRKELPKLVQEMISTNIKEEVRQAVKEIKDATPVVQAPFFSDILKDGTAAGPVSRITTLIRREEEAREQKKDRIVIRGMELQESSETETETDEEIVRKIADELDVSLDGVRVDTKRVGTKKNILSVKLPMDQRLQMLRNSKKLKDHATLSSVYISPDRTPGELHADYLLRCELKEKRESEPGRQWVISKGKVVSKDF